MTLFNESVEQLFRYGLIGSLLNAAMYCIYLVLTAFYFSPIGTVSLLYPTVVLVGFFAHRGFTFKKNSKKWKVFEISKYAFLHAIGFLLNFVLLYVFFERLGYPHQLVQFFAIFIVAGFLFISLKLFVFPAVQDKETTI